MRPFRAFAAFPLFSLFLGAVVAVPGCGGGDGGGFTPPDPPFSPCYNSIAPEGPAQGAYRLFSHQTNVCIADVAISDWGWRAVAGGQDNKIYYFDRSKAAPRFAYTTGGQVNAVDISQEGSGFVAGSGDGIVYFFECDQQQPAWTYDTSQDSPIQESIVEDVSIDYLGRWIAAVSQTHLYLFRRDQAKPVLKLDLGSQFLATVEIAALGSHLVAGTRPEAGNQARVFYLDHTGLLWTYAMADLGFGPNDLPVPVAVNHDGSRVAAGGPDNRIHFWAGAGGSVPQWTYQIASESPVFSVDLSFDGSQLVAAGNWTFYYFDSTGAANPAPAFTHDGSRQDASPLFPQPDIYQTNPQGSTGGSGVGNFLHAAAVSGNGSYGLAAENINHLAFGYYRNHHEGPVRSYDLDDTVNCVDIAADGSWVMLGGTYNGVIRRFEVAPIEIVEVKAPLTYRIIDDDLDQLAQLLGGSQFNVQYTIAKPGRAAVLKEEWGMWAQEAGLLLPPQNPFCTGTKSWDWTQTLAGGNVETGGTRQISPPQCLESGITSMDLFVLEAELNDQPSGSDLSEDSATLATVQIGGAP